MNSIIRSFQNTARLPLGKSLFTYMVARKAPYFKSIPAIIDDIQTNYCKIKMPLQKRVTNHIGTVHAIAMCNMCELAMGMASEASIPAHRRWIPMNMSVNYLKKADTNLIAICDLSDADWENADVPCYVSVRNTADVEVMNATITLRVTAKPAKKKKG